jgi:hypothetical protein
MAVYPLEECTRYGLDTEVSKARGSRSLPGMAVTSTRGRILDGPPPSVA